jgi:hypothetical protein
MSSGYHNYVLSFGSQLASQDRFNPIINLQDFKVI